ncbi:hypothetical protein QN277_006123 [Acacia crassicarpa]|uniref:Uncharacterized protein n=1 Tax=Acacia crassicarpa TaxID=499986 RepID=A0AAE1IZR7_9FABA|nr:hypothetical protein QN277_006123 [Acacia crassicarpa]
MEEQVNLDDDELPETPQQVEEAELSETNHETVTTQVNASDANLGRRKKRKLNNAEVIAEALRDTATQLDKTIPTAFDKLDNMMGPQERQPEPPAPRDDLYMELLQIQDLTWNERNLAHMKIIPSDKMVNHFMKVPLGFKELWIQTLLDQ